MSKSNYSTLPPSLRKLIKVLGECRTLDFLALYGGTLIVIPIRSTSKSRLREFLTPKEFNNFVLAFNPNNRQFKKLVVPMPHKLIKLTREITIKEDIKNGMTIRALALKNQLTERRILQIKKKLRESEE